METKVQRYFKSLKSLVAVSLSLGHGHTRSPTLQNRAAVNHLKVITRTAKIQRFVHPEKNGKLWMMLLAKLDKASQLSEHPLIPNGRSAILAGFPSIMIIIPHCSTPPKLRCVHFAHIKKKLNWRSPQPGEWIRPPRPESLQVQEDWACG